MAIFHLRYCLYISSAIFKPFSHTIFMEVLLLYFVRYINGYMKSKRVKTSYRHGYSVRNIRVALPWNTLDTLKSLSVKSVLQVLIRDACGAWQDLNTITSIRSIQKSTRKSQKLGNQLVSGWLKIQGSKQREIELISKIVWRKRNAQIGKLITAPCEEIWKLLLKNICHQKMQYSLLDTNILLVDMT